MRTIEILNWHSFYNLVVILLLSFFFVFYSFFLNMQEINSIIPLTDLDNCLLDDNS